MWDYPTWHRTPLRASDPSSSDGGMNSACGNVDNRCQGPAGLAKGIRPRHCHHRAGQRFGAAYPPRQGDRRGRTLIRRGIRPPARPGIATLTGGSTGRSRPCRSFQSHRQLAGLPPRFRPRRVKPACPSESSPSSQVAGSRSKSVNWHQCQKPEEFHFTLANRPMATGQ
jgi:hypothetical protein